MKVALVCINAKYIHASLAPWYLLAAIQEQGNHLGTVVEGSINETTDALCQRIEEQGPDIVCCSAYIWNIGRLMELAKELKKRRPGIRIVLGGPEVSFDAEEWMERIPQADCILKGEGEESLPILLDRMEDGKGFADVPGCCYRMEGEIQENAVRPREKERPGPEPDCVY